MILSKKKIENNLKIAIEKYKNNKDKNNSDNNKKAKEKNIYLNTRESINDIV